MKVLVVSHNVFCDTTNMGKTLKTYFTEFNSSDIAQFYIHSEIPTCNCCDNYYRFTDKDAIKSILFCSKGNIYNKSDVIINKNKSSRATGNLEGIYQYCRKRSPLIYFVRNNLWNVSRLFSNKFKKWIDDFKPDVIFFSAGDYAFMYKLALKIANYANCPLVMCCMDDYYINNKNNKSILGKLVHKNLLKYAKKVFERSSFAFTICDKMAKDYEKLFNKKCFVLHTGSKDNNMKLNDKTKNISYIGNLGYNRYMQLIDIGKSLLKITNGSIMLDVYSAENRDFVLKELNENNGIKFHGKISSDEVLKVMSNSMLVIHTESFDNDIKNSVRYSVSTKIADSLMNGPCLLAYGPNDVASIEYLKDNDAAYVIDNKNDLDDKLKEIINNKELRDDIIKNARKLASKNHNSDVNGKYVKEKLSSII